MNIKIEKSVGTFAENKDVARNLRIMQIMPALQQGKEVVLDFSGVTGATQSFVHALISDAIREYGEDVYDHLLFKGCSDPIGEVIMIVAEYMRESDT